MRDKLIARAEQDRGLALRAGERTFDFCSRQLRAYKAAGDGGSERMMLEAVASSTIVDRMGDQIDLACLEGMKQQAAGMTSWLNHSYSVPEDVFGTITETKIVPAEDPAQGSCYDLIATIEVDGENPRAVQAWKHVKAGRRLGLSIGGQISDYDFIDPDDFWFSGLEIHAMDLWEISLVGIPANQRAIVEGVGKGIRKKLGRPIDPIVRDAQKAALARGFTARDAENGGLETEEPAAGHEPGTGGEGGASADPPAPTIAPAAPSTAAEPHEETPAPKPGAVPGYASIQLAIAPTVDVRVVRAALAAAFGETVIVKEGRRISEETARCLREVRDSIMAAHEHNTPQGEKLDSAVSALDELLVPGDEGDEPGGYPDANDPDVSYSVTRAADLKREIAQLEGNREQLETVCRNLIRANGSLLDEAEKLEGIVRTLKGVPIGRATVPAYAGAGASTADAAFRRRPAQQVLRDLDDANRGATDARARSLTA